MSREAAALGSPPADTSGCPRVYLRGTRTVYRAHRADRGPWWYSSDGWSRFDLTAPRGTCYLASTTGAALRERFGDRLTRRGYVMAAMANETVVSALHVTDSHRLANVCAQGAAAVPGLTREISTITPYRLSRQWAEAFARDGFAGVQYAPRFSTGEERAYALFGEAGTRDWPGDPAPVGGRQAAVAAGLTVLAVPRSVLTIDPEQ